MYELLVDGYGTLWVAYWSGEGDDESAMWLVPGTIDPMDD